jgi:transcriptional regulator with XRE-family HTH domain
MSTLQLPEWDVALEKVRALERETIGTRLRRLRTEAGLSQRELAEPGVSYAYISRVENGQRRPSTRALRLLAPKLGITADELEFGEAGIKGNPTFRALQRRIVQLEDEKRRLLRVIEEYERV